MVQADLLLRIRSVAQTGKNTADGNGPRGARSSLFDPVPQVAEGHGVALFWKLKHSVRIRFSKDGKYLFRTQAGARDRTPHGIQPAE